MNRDIDMNNLNWLVKNYDLTQDHYMLGLDIHSQGGADLVLYDISDMLETPKDYDDFKSIIYENALDEREFEVHRVCLTY